MLRAKVKRKSEPEGQTPRQFLPDFHLTGSASLPLRHD